MSFFVEEISGFLWGDCNGLNCLSQKWFVQVLTPWASEVTLLGKRAQFSSVAQLCLTLCDPTGYSTPGFPVHHQTLRACSNSCPSSQRCHSTISSSVISFSCPQFSPASGSFLMSQLFPSDGQSIGTSASASVLLKNIQDWLPLGWTGWISLQSKGLSRVFSNTIAPKH